MCACACACACARAFQLGARMGSIICSTERYGCSEYNVMEYKLENTISLAKTTFLFFSIGFSLSRHLRGRRVDVTSSLLDAATNEK